MSTRRPPKRAEQVWDLLENTGLLRSPVPMHQTFRVPRKATLPKSTVATPWVDSGETWASDSSEILDTIGGDGTLAEGMTSLSESTDLANLLPLLNDDAPFSEAQLKAFPEDAHNTNETFSAVGSTTPLEELDFYPYLPILQVADSENDDGQTDLRFREVVGEGGAGQIVLADQRSLFREVALKRSKAEAKVPFPEEMLLQEGMVTGHLEHPNIIPVHAMGLDAERAPVLVMKYVEGVPWSELLGDDTHPFWNKLKTMSREPMIRHIEILLEICDAVEFAHARGILHRDIKPQNVMLGAFGEVYLLDWGLGFVSDPQSPLAPAMEALTPIDEEEGFYGTPQYMAPEMLEDECFLGPWTDIYLLAGVLYEIMHGLPPHQGETIEDVILAIFDETPPDFAANCPAELVRICEKALQFDPADRYQDVAAFRSDLVGFLQHRASLTLSDEAWSTLRRLQSAVAEDSAESYRERDLPLRRWYDTCHFGFLQALREWPENAEAQRGLQEAFQSMFWVDLDQGHLEAAALLLEDLEASLGTSTPETAAMGVALDTARQKQARLQHIHHAADFSVARHQRVRLMIGMGVAATLFALVRLWLGSATDLGAGYRRALGFVALTTVALVGGLFWGRKALFQNDANRRFVQLVIMCTLAITIHRGFRAFHSDPLHITFVFDLVLLGCMIAVASLTLRLWLGWIAGVMLVGATLGWLWPGQVYHIMTVCIAAGWLLCGFFWSREHGDLAVS